MSKTGKRTCLELARQIYERAQRERYISCSTLHHPTGPCCAHISSSTLASEVFSSKIDPGSCRLPSQCVSWIPHGPTASWVQLMKPPLIVSFRRVWIGRCVY